MISDAQRIAIESMPVLIVCPVCNDSTMAPNLKILDETIHAIWQLTKSSMDSFFGEQASAMAIASAGIYNKIENQVEQILEKGYLRIICKTCMTDESQRIYEKAGTRITRIGNVLFEVEFYRKNKKWINKSMNEKAHLFRKTFWT